MEDSLSDLFTVIINSEKMVLDEKKKHQEVKEKIERTKILIEKQQLQICTGQMRIQQMEDGLATSRVGINQLKVKEQILHQNMVQTNSGIKTQEEKRKSLDALLKETSFAFMAEVQNFCTTYGPGSKEYLKKSNVQAKERSQQITRDIEQLIKEIHNMKELEMKLDQVIADITIVAQNIQQLSETEREQDIDSEEAEKALLLLKQDTQSSLDVPQNDKKYVDLRNELENLQTSELEAQAEQLHCDLRKLMETQRKKEKHNLKQQYKQWKRERRCRFKSESSLE